MAFKATSITYYGCPSKFYDIVIWCPHDAEYLSFFKEFPHLWLNLVRDHGLELTRKYLMIERDIGSIYLARKTISHLLKLYTNNISIALIISNIPRAIIDPARIAGAGMRNIFFSKIPNDTLKKLKFLHSCCYIELNTLIEKLTTHGYFIDLHTMAPLNPSSNSSTKTEYIIESPETLSQYVAAYCELPWSYKSRERKIDLITHDNLNFPIADKKLASCISQLLLSKKIPFSFNEPYSTANHLLAFHIMKIVKGITIDIPKHYVSEEDESNFELTNFNLSLEKIQQLANIIAFSIFLAKN